MITITCIKEDVEVSMIDLTKGQKKARLHASRGKSLFITGGAGTGKTTCLEEIIQTLENMGKRVVVCAPTGKAALKVKGVTTYALFGFPAGMLINPGGVDRSPSIVTRVSAAVRTADVVIVDEVSMISCWVFDSIVASIRKAEKEVGKRIQLIVCGDFFSFPPFWA
ncbi:MAG: AAA family ATPase [Blautia sp.]|nr:AAA family ATPase [Blautia sp.]